MRSIQVVATPMVYVIIKPFQNNIEYTCTFDEGSSDEVSFTVVILFLFSDGRSGDRIRVRITAQDSRDR